MTYTPERLAGLKDSTHRAAERIVRALAKAHHKCGLHYAHGLTERWCDRAVAHPGPCSGQLFRG